MTTIEQTDADAMAAELAAFYGEGDGAPTHAQWRDLAAAPDGGPICVVNFVKMRAEAQYPPGAADAPCSGMAAFMRYAAGSTPRIGAVGGAVTFGGRQERTFIGPDEDWDVIVVATYPNRASFLRLFQDPEYREAFRHRRAGVERYRAAIGATPA